MPELRYVFRSGEWRMNTTSSSGRSANETRERGRPAVAWLTLAALLLGTQVAAQEQTAAPERKAAVLKVHEVSFFYRSRVAPLSCSDLEGRVSMILRALGARDDVNVNATGCDTVVTSLDDPMDASAMPNDRWQTPSDRYRNPSDRWQTSSDPLRNHGARREQSSHIRVRAMMPIEVTPEVLEEIRKDKSRRELVSRLTRNPAASLDDPILFPAQRREVTLSKRTIDVEPGDCELLQQMSSSVFRQLHMRVVRGANCDRDEISRIPPQITVETLMPIFENPQPAPAVGSGEPDPGAPGASAAPPSSSEQPAAEPPPG